jgi:hypothetical protein
VVSPTQRGGGTMTILKNSFPAVQLTSILDSYADFTTSLHDKFRNVDTIPKIYETEQDYNAFHTANGLLDDSLLSHLYSHIDETEIIKRVRAEYAQKNIRLENVNKGSITIQTDLRRITIVRTLLSPYPAKGHERILSSEDSKNIYPLDKVIGIDYLPFKLTVSAMLKISRIAQQLPSFKEASNVLKDDYGIELDPTTIIDVTSLIGYIIFKHNVERAYFIGNHMSDICVEDEKKIKDGILYLEVDGAMVNLRGGIGVTPGWHEHKLGLIYDSRNTQIRTKTNKDGKIETKLNILQKEYVSLIGSADRFKILFFECALRNNYFAYDKTIVLSDGAKWIHNMATELFPTSIHILDYFHLSKKVWDFGKDAFNKNDKKYTPWCTMVCEHLKQSRPQDAIEEISKICKSSKKVKAEAIIPYIENNINSIDYKSYNERGFAIGSGAIESSNKSVMQKRLKGPGMRWNPDTAQALCTLRSKYESGRWYSDVVVPVHQYYNIPIPAK